VGAFNEEAFLKYQTSPDNILSSNYSSKETGLHPTQKPIVLMKTLIELTTKEGQIVLDPFCGSGTTLLAAKELNRKYIGFELDDDYYGIAKKRIQ
jgi:site-specific DNA-methyltransferase (adenine-specific)